MIRGQSGRIILTDGKDNLIPDLSPSTIQFLLERHPMPVYSGDPRTHADYQRQVGKWELVQELQAHYEQYTGD